MSDYPVPIPEMITSAANDEVKRLRALHERKFRRQTGWFLAEGARICHEAVDLGWVMHRLAFVAGREDDPHVNRLLGGLVTASGKALPMTQSLLQRISRKDNPQIVLGAFGHAGMVWIILTLASTKHGWPLIVCVTQAISGPLCAPPTQWAPVDLS